MSFVGGLFGLPGFVNNFYRGYKFNRENDRWWNDYRRNTGMSPKYPFRQGAKTDWVGWAVSPLSYAGGMYNSYQRDFGGGMQGGQGGISPKQRTLDMYG